MLTISEAIVLFDNYSIKPFTPKKANELHIGLYSLKHMALFGIAKVSINRQLWRIVKNPYEIRD